MEKTKKELPSALQLLGKSWKLYESHLKTILLTLGVPYLLLFILLMLSFWIRIAFPFKNLEVFSFIIFFLIFLFIIPLSNLALLYSIKEEHSLSKAYKKAWANLLPFLNTSVTANLSIEGGNYLVIPGIIFNVQLLFVPLVYILEGKTNEAALARSKQLVQDRFKEVYWKMIVINLVQAPLGILLYACFLLMGFYSFFARFSSSYDTGIASVLVVIFILIGIYFLVFRPFATFYQLLLYYELCKEKGTAPPPPLPSIKGMRAFKNTTLIIMSIVAILGIIFTIYGILTHKILL